MTDAPHTCFTVAATSYLRNLDREDLRGEHIAVHYQAPPKRLDDGRTAHSLIMPVLILSLYLEDRQGVAEKVAALLNKHWDDDAETVDKARAWDAATSTPPKAAKEHAALRDAVQRFLPKNLCLDNRNIPDDMIVGLDVGMGELRALAAALAGEVAAHG